MTTNTEVGGVILAGGQARRLGGVDKGLIELCGSTMIEHSIHTFAPQVQPLMISANRNLADYRAFGFEVIEDRFGSFEGPLAGLWRALEAARTPLLATLPCDAPLAPDDFVARLHRHFVPGQTLAVIAHDGTGLADFLEQGGRKVHDWVRSLDPVRVDFSDCVEAFRNVNTAEDLAAIQDKIQCQTHS